MTSADIITSVPSPVEAQAWASKRAAVGIHPKEVDQTTPWIERLRANASLDHETLEGSSKELGGEFIDYVRSSNDLETQRLLAIVGAGDTLFAIIEVSTFRPNNAGLESGRYFLAKLDEKDHSSQIVGVISPQAPLVVGRARQVGLAGDRHISRDHFLLEFNLGKHSGLSKFTLTDTNSTNGTEVFQAEPRDYNVPPAEGILEIKNELTWAIPEDNMREWQRVLDEQSTPIDQIETSLSVLLSASNVYRDPSAFKIMEVAKGLTALQDRETTEVLREIVVDSSLNGLPIPPRLGKGGEWLDKKYRLFEIYQKNPEVADLLVEKSVAGFHGSSSASLLGVLEHGLLTQAELRKQDRYIGSGERTVSPQGGQPAISFGDWRVPKTIEQYAHLGAGSALTAEALRARAKARRASALEAHRLWGEEHPWYYNGIQNAIDDERLAQFIDENPDSELAELLQLNFPVAYGVNINEYDRYRTEFDIPGEWQEGSTRNVVLEFVRSDVKGEFMVYGSRIAPKEISVIAVPREHIPRVEKLIDQFGHAQMKVIPIEAIIG